MLVARLDLALLAICVTGIVWMAMPSPASAPEPRLVLDDQTPRSALRMTCSTNGGMPEAMQGPFAHLSDAVGGELDIETMTGVAPYAQLTVMRTGEGASDLTNHDRLVLAVQVGGLWFTHELASLGPFCGGTGSPTWVDAEAAAPRIVDGAVSVRAHETYRQGDSERSADSLVECRLEP